MKLEKNLKQHQDIIVIFLGISLGLTALWAIFKDQKTAFDALGLGVGTTAVYQKYEGRHVHCSDLSTANKCIADANHTAKKRIALLGWSQLHGVNQYQEGDHTAPWLLAKDFAQKNIDFLTFSQGRANPQEHFVLFEWLTSQTRIDGLVIGAWIQGMREEGIRPDIASA